ncbi:hypothetical protein [Granulicoccus phenolivorans]|uniref:hypothetical protein n=1 Tax=Granulicoccus phenolivorans TaxID=266854 RepID=UPI00042086F8|nr:hypothetical protein [Granulicoccus phenolivorans]
MARSRRRRQLILGLVGCCWLVLIGVASWLVGYALTVRGNPLRYAAGVANLWPLAYGAWVGLPLLLGALWNLRWLRGRLPG